MVLLLLLLLLLLLRGKRGGDDFLLVRFSSRMDIGDALEERMVVWLMGCDVRFGILLARRSRL